MKLVLKIVLLFILAIVIAVLYSYGPGHVVMFVSGYRIDLSLATLVLVVLIIYAVLHYVSAFLSSIYNIPGGIQHYRHKTALIKSRNYFNIAATNYFLNEYKLAYSNALKSMSYNISVNDKFPVLLLALDAIHLMDDSDRGESDKIDRLVRKLFTASEESYVYQELTKINKVQNNRFYSELLTKLNKKTISFYQKIK